LSLVNEENDTRVYDIREIAGKSDAAREKENFMSARIEGTLNSPSISKLGAPV
jgi:hypothetical protein